MKFGIDVRTKDKQLLIVRLAGLKTTIQVEDGGVYREDDSYSQVHVESSWTEEQLESWLYTTKGIEYVGVFVMKEAVPCTT